MNLYQQLSMKPPSKNTLATRLLGSRSVYTGVAVPVRRPDAAQMWRTTDVVHNTPNMPARYLLGDQGGLAGFAGLRGFGAADPALELVPGVSFRFDIDKKDFVTGRPIHQEGIRKLGLSWTPVTPAFVQSVTKKLQDLRSSGSAGETMADSLIADGSLLAKKVGDVGEAVEWEAFGLGARGEVDIFGKVIRNTVERNRLDAMKELKAWMQYVVDVPIPTSQSSYTPTTVSPSYTPGSLPSSNTTSLTTNRDLVTTGVVKPVSTGLNVPLLLGGAAALVVGVLVIKKMRK